MKHLKRKKVGNIKKREVKSIIDMIGYNEVVRLMSENNALECEKKRTKSMVEVWKDKYKKL